MLTREGLGNDEIARWTPGRWCKWRKRFTTTPADWDNGEDDPSFSEVCAVKRCCELLPRRRRWPLALRTGERIEQGIVASISGTTSGAGFPRCDKLAARSGSFPATDFTTKAHACSTCTLALRRGPLAQRVRDQRDEKTRAGRIRKHPSTPPAPAADAGEHEYAAAALGLPGAWDVHRARYSALRATTGIDRSTAREQV